MGEHDRVCLYSCNSEKITSSRKRPEIREGEDHSEFNSVINLARITGGPVIKNI